jgi:hypothetical protein
MSAELESVGCESIDGSAHLIRLFFNLCPLLQSSVDGFQNVLFGGTEFWQDLVDTTL